MKTKAQSMLQTLEMEDIFRVEIVDNKKRVSRWGFFANVGNGEYAIYKPERSTCDTKELFMIEDDGPAAIDIVDKSEIEAFVCEIESGIKGIPAMAVSESTPCGWYYDTLC